MKITWEVEDGYVGGARPHHSEIPDEDFEGMTEEEKEKYIQEWIQDDFSNSIFWSITKIEE